MKKIICLLVGVMIIGTSLCVLATETKSTEAPVINYTLSETEDTWNPITVTLNITDDEEIVDIRYVRLNSVWHSGWPESENEIDTASVSYDIDCTNLFLGEYSASLEELEKVCGTKKAGSIASEYYVNAFEIAYNEKDEVVYNDKYSITVENNNFSVYCNDFYIIYAEDKTGNKTFKKFEVNNIKSASAEVDLNIYSDFSGEYIAEAKLNVTENPNAPVKNIYLYKHSSQLVGAGGSFQNMAASLVERIQCDGYTIPSVNGVYYLKGFGKYKIIFEDAWGVFSTDSFDFSPCGTDIPEFECKLYSHENDNIRVEIEPSKDNIAKLEYVQVGSSYRQLPAEYFFESVAKEIDRTVIKDNSFIAEPGKIYAVRALSTDGSAAYQMVETNKNDVDNYLYDIKNLSILTESETLIVPPKNKSFIAEVEVNKKNESGDSKDYIIAAVYDKKGMLMHIDYAEANFDTNNDDASFDFNIPAQSREIGSIKAYVWNDFNSMKPLAEAKQFDFYVVNEGTQIMK